MSSLPAKVSVFPDTTTTTPGETLSLGAVLDRIQAGVYRWTVNRLRTTLARQGKDAYTAAKRRLPAFTPAGTFTQRNSASLATPSGCLNLDLDDVPDLDHARALIGADPHLLYMFVSPSGAGLKLGMHVSGYTDAATYRHAWLAVERYLVETYPDLAVSNDASCKDVSRLCYVSWDPDLYRTSAAVPFPVPPIPAPAPRAPAPRSPTPLPADRRQYYASHAIATAITLLDASVAPSPTSHGTRDQQRLKASRLLGGYIAGGILSEPEATAGIAAAVERNTADVDRAWKVIKKGLRYGDARPLSLDDLEADYQQWLKTHTARPPKPRPVPDMTGHAPPGAAASWPPRGCTSLRSTLAPGLSPTMRSTV